jgi:hypothetical protein
MIASAGLIRTKTLALNPMAPKTIASEKCMRRARVRSAVMPVTTIAAIAAE